MTASVIYLENALVPQGREILTLDLESEARKISSLAPSDWSVPYVAFLDGAPILRADWEQELRQGQNLLFIDVRAIPQGGGGGGGSDPLRTVLMIAVIVGTSGMGGALLGIEGAAAVGSMGVGIANAAVTMLGVALVNALVPPPKPLSTQQTASLAAASPTYSTQAQGNTGRIGSAIPEHFGRMIAYPDFAAQPYVEYSGNEQYLYQLLCIGRGSYYIETIKIEDTPIWNFATVDGDVQVETIEPGSSPTLFPTNVVTSTEVSGIDMSTQWLTVGPFVANAPGTTLNYIGIDLVMPKGLYWANDDGSLASAGLSVLIEAQPVDSFGTATGGWVTIGNEAISGATTTPIRKSFRYAVASGRYQVRVSRTDPKNTTSRVGHDISWSGLRGYLASPATSYGDVTLLAVRIKASNSLSSQSSRKINMVVTRKLPQWNSGVWGAATATRSPAWAIAYACKQVGLTDAQIDLSALRTLDSTWATRGDWFDGRFDNFLSFWEAITKMAQAGRAKPFMQAGVLRVIRDQASTTPVAMFSMRNIIKGSFSIDYLMPTAETSDSVKASYFDNTVWKPSSITTPRAGTVSDVAQKPAKVDLFGITDRSQAYREAIYQAACNKYRRKIIKFQTEMEGFIPSFGDLISIQHDMPGWGQGGEVLAYDTVTRTATLSEPLTWSTGAHYIAFRSRDGGSNGPYLVSAGTLATQVVLASVPNPVPYIGYEEERTYYSFGWADTYRQLARVLTIKPSSLTRVSIECVNEDSNVHTADQGVITPVRKTSQLSSYQGAPSVVGTAVVANPAARHQFIVSWVPSPWADSYIVEQSTDNLTWSRVVETTVTSVTATAVGDENHPTYIRVAALGVARGAWASVTYTMAALENVAGLATSMQSNGILVSWTASSDLDYSETELRLGASWDTAAVVGKVSGVNFVIPWQPAGSQTVWAKHTDTYKKQSPVAAFVTMTISAPPATSSLTATISGQTLMLNWAAVTSAQRTVTYEVRRAGVLLTALNSLSYPLTADWVGSMSFTVAAVDSFGNVGAAASVSKVVSAPSAPTLPTVAFVSGQYVFTWAEAASDIPVASYEIQTGGTAWGVGTLQLGSVSALSYKGAVNWGGAKTFRIKAKSTTGFLGAEATVVSSVSIPGSPTISAPTYGGSTIKLSWSDASTSLPIESYHVSYGPAFASSVSIGVVSANTLTINADWVGTRRIWVSAEDVATNQGTPGFLDISIAVPGAPTITQASVVAGKVSVVWTPGSTTVAVAKYRISVGSTFAGSTAVSETTGTSADFVPTWSGTTNVYVAAVDASGNLGTEASSAVNIAIPSVPTVSVTFSGVSALLSWANATQSLPITKYEVRRGSTWSAGVVLGVLSALNLTIPANWSGADTIWVMATDSNGNSSPTASVISSIPAPSTPTVSFSISGTSALLSWNDCKTTLPISTYEIRLGTVWASATPLGTANALSFSTPITWSGNNTIMVRALDTANNAGVEASVASNIVVPSAPVVSISYSGSNAKISWTDSVQTLPIAKYEVRRGSTWAAAITLGTVTALNVTVPAEWLGSDTIHVRATDAVGNLSAVGTVAATILAPAVPVPVSSFAANSAVLTWADCKTTLPILEYEVRTGTSWATGSLVGVVSAKQISIVANWAGSRTFWVAARDFFGNLGAAAQVITTVSAPAAPAVTSAVAGNSVQLSWTVPAASLSISGYEVRQGATWAAGTVLGDITGTTFSVPINWAGSQTFWVAASDSTGTFGAAGQVSATITAPSTPSVTSSIKDSSLILSWTGAIGTLPLDHFEIRVGSGAWSAATFVSAVTSNSLVIPINWVGSNTYQIVSIDSVGNVSGVASTVATVVVPAAPTITPSFVSDQFILNWTIPASTLAVRSYEIRAGNTSSTWGTATSFGTVSGTTFSASAQWTGVKRWFVAAIDSNGNAGTPAQSDVTINAAAAPAVTAQVVDNNILLYWTCAAGTLPISTFELRRGATWATATSIGTKSGGFTTIFETVAGVFTYWIAAIDTAGNTGTPSFVSATVSQPPDYVLKGNWTSTFTTGGGVLAAVKTNMAQDQLNGSWLLPVNTTETFQTHFDTRAWAGPSAQEGATPTAFPLFIQPALTGVGSYAETFDYGTVLASSKVTLTLTGSVLSGTPAVVTKIETSLDNIAWTMYSGVSQVFATNFRYVRITVQVTAATGLDIYRLTGLGYRLDSKLRNDAGMGVAGVSDSVTGANAVINGVTVNGSNPTVNGVSVPNGAGTLVLFATPFIDITSLDVTVGAGSTARYGVYDFADVPNATGFKVILYDASGTRVGGSFSWSTKGY